MTDVPLAPAAPEGGWADAPRPPRTVVLTEDHSRRLGTVALRSTQLSPLVTRLVLAVVLGVLLGATQAPRIGVVVGLAFALLALGLAALAVRRVRSIDLTGTTRTTGYDSGGRFAFAGTTRHPAAPRVGEAGRAPRRDRRPAAARPPGRTGRPRRRARHAGGRGPPHRRRS